MLDILLYGASLILEFVAVIVLRIREPHLDRPFRLPGGKTGAIFVGLLPTVLLFVAGVKSRHDRLGSVSALLVGLAVIGAGLLAYFLISWVRQVRGQSKLCP
jgi:amino acid transporter